jgi:hypothetical protein
MNSVVKLGKCEKNLLTPKKIMYLKSILKETINHIQRKKYLWII